MDHHRFQRQIYEVLDHDPTEEDIPRFFLRFQEALTARGLSLQGITTDGSPLYPTAIRNVFGSSVRPQVCLFPILAERNKAVLKAVAQARRELKATRPKRGSGRPSKAHHRLAARKKRLESKVPDVFDHRHLFVQRPLTAAEQKTLPRITRGRPDLRALRQIVEEVYRWFDRRGRTDTALAKLARLRRRVGRGQSLRQTLHTLHDARAG